MISKTFQSCDSIKGSLVELNSLSLYTLTHMGWLQTSHPFGSEQLLRQRELGVLKVPRQEAPCAQLGGDWRSLPFVPDLRVRENGY